MVWDYFRSDAYFADLIDPSLQLSDLAWLREAAQLPIWVKGIVRADDAGTDVIKALALGASAVRVGCPVLWGLAVAGQRGVEHVLGLLQRELDLALGLCGCPDLAHLTRDLVAQSKARD